MYLATVKLGFQQALALARRQQTKSWELRAAMSWRGCGNARASGPKLRSCWRRAMAGLLKDLTRLTCKTPERCSTH